MKRPLSNSDPLIPLCPSGEEKGMYGREFQPMMDGLDDENCGDEEFCSAGGAQQEGGGDKKRRLSVEQVRALEKNFEVENKLEPERKVRLAQELGLQPRQVAVWFQNRRARWKTKQLERDYAALKVSYDTLRLDYDSLQRDKVSLLSEIKELKAKLAEEESLSFSSVKEEPVVSEAEDDKVEISAVIPALIYKDGSSTDSDSSAGAVLNDAAVLNDENRPLRRRVPTTMASEKQPAAINVGLASSSSSFPANYSNSTVLNGNLSDSRTVKGGFFYQHHQQILKMEENEFLSGEEPCSHFFTEEQAPTLNWYYSDHCWS